MRYFEFVTEIKAVTNIDKGEEIYIPASDHKKATYETKIKGYEIYHAKSKLGPMPLEHFLVKDPDSDGFLGELKLTGFHKYYSSDVFFDPQIQGKGLALPLYAYVVKKGYDLVSDREQSKGSQAIWKNLTKVPGIFVYAWSRKYDEFFQRDPDEDLDSEIYHDEEKIKQLDQDYKDGKIGDEDYKKAKDELEQVKRLSDVRLVAIDEKKPVKESLEEITRRDLLKGIGVAGAAAATGAKVDIAKAMGGSTAREKIQAMEPGEQFWYVKVKDPKKPTDRQEYVFSLDTFKNEDDAMKTIRQHFREYGYETDINIEVTLAKRK